MNPYIIVGALLAIMISASGGYFKGRHDEFADQQIEISKQKDIAREREKELQNEIDKQTQTASDERASIERRLSVALERLRERPERLPETSSANCKGSTGAELSGSDAVFLERLAARAETLRKEVIRCYAYADSIQSD